MTDTQTSIAQLYSAFNQREIDRALALMADSVSWPKASEGGRVIGKEAIRAYWTRQWQEFDPHVEPLAVTSQPDGTVLVQVHQMVRSMDGSLLSDSEVRHQYTFQDGLITAMNLQQDGAAADTVPSTAFSKR